MSPRVAALRQAVDSAPDDHVLRLLLAEALRDAAEPAAAVEQYGVLLRSDALDASEAVQAAQLALAVGRRSTSPAVSWSGPATGAPSRA